MKKLILTTAITLVAFAGAFAQSTTSTTPATTTNPGPASANADLSVTINPIQSIWVNGEGVNLNYASTTDYKDGVTEARANHLTVYSTGAFQVKVKATDLASDGAEVISASGISVTAATGSGEDGLATLKSAGTVNLPTDNAATIFTSSLGGVNRTVDVTYKGKGGDAYINKYFKNANNKSVYKTTVVYSIESM